MATTLCRVTGNISDLGLTSAQGYVLRVVPEPRTIVVGDKTVTLADVASAVVGPTGQVQFTVPAEAYLTIIPTLNGATLPGISVRAPLRETASLISCIVMSPPVPVGIQELIHVVEAAAASVEQDVADLEETKAQVALDRGAINQDRTFVEQAVEDIQAALARPLIVVVSDASQIPVPPVANTLYVVSE